MIRSNETGLGDIRAKVEAGQMLSLEDGVRLYRSPDIHTIGELANMVRERLHGRTTYYNINRHINYTNYCVLRCKFCSFYRPYPKGSDTEPVKDSDSNPDGYEITVEQMVERARQAYDSGATEVHIVGGLHPTWPFSYYLDLCKGIRNTCPHIHIKAFTAIEIIHFTRISKPRLSIEQVLTQLTEAGLGSLPGGGAEIFDDRVHHDAFKNKVGEAQWFDVHRSAHALGIFTNATMLYGHIETLEERITHLIKLREHQARSLETGKSYFNCVIPLSFIPEGSELAHLLGPSGLDDLKTLAITRLMCPNINHIKAFWIMQTPKLAQVSLDWGVDDIDGTVVYYDITKREGDGSTHQEMSVNDLKRLIAEANGEAIERDTLYRTVTRDNQTWQIDGEPWKVHYSPMSAPNEKSDPIALGSPGFVNLSTPT